MTLKDRMDAFWNAFEAGDFQRIACELCAADIEFVMPGVPPLKGARAVLELWQGWRAAFPDMRHETRSAIEQSRSYAAETRFVATHSGTLRSPQGEVPPTGRTLRWESADIVRFEGDKIASWHVYHDQIPLLTQLGLIGGSPNG